ncbi:MAG: DNA methylase, partial [Saccharofermentans sp.]|nr:DNA methylase [Saccharofermentans sp.]
MRHYVAIDLKSFYASVECVDRGLDPLTARLVVADESRTAKTICLAVSPALKAYGIPGRARLFEVNKKAKEASIDFIIAPPRMARYVEVSTQIYEIYLKYVSHDDMHVYSIDEVFIDVTDYLDTYKMTPEELAMTMIKDVLSETGVTATAGIGTNMYLAKIAMDIVAKHAKADENGVRMASLDEMSYRKELWNHRPLTDFWRVGRGYEKRLNSIGLYTMGDVARCSLGKETDYFNEDLLYRIFGVNAELLIDHAWGYEPCTMAEIHAYKPETNSISTGQVLHCPYDHEKTRLIVKEMMELLSLDLVEKRLKTKQIVLNIGYDIENITNKDILKKYEGEVVVDHYGRKIPKGSHGTENLDKYTSSGVVLTEAVLRLYDRITNPDLLVRRLNIVACNVVTESVAKEKEKFVQ